MGHTAYYMTNVHYDNWLFERNVHYDNWLFESIYSAEPLLLLLLLLQYIQYCYCCCNVIQVDDTAV
jgi:hypothetical protein